MKEDITKWIWQHKDYPNFKYNKLELTDLLTQIEYNRGILGQNSTLGLNATKKFKNSLI